MRARVCLIASAMIVLALSGCISKKAVLTNEQGQTITCEHSGHVGIVSPIVVYTRQHSCIHDAEAKGYKVTESPPSGS
jgi:hypothetical protein